MITDIEADGYSDRHDRVAAATYYHQISELVDELANAGLTGVAVHGLTGPGGCAVGTVPA